MSERLGSELDGWRVEEYGRSRGGLPLRVFLPEGDGPVAGLLTAGQHGEEADTSLLVRRLLERIPAAETRWAVIPVLNPDGLLAGTRQNAAGVDLNRNFPAVDLGAGRDLHLSPRDRSRDAGPREPEEPVLAGRARRLGAGDAGADRTDRAPRARRSSSTCTARSSSSSCAATFPRR